MKKSFYFTCGQKHNHVCPNGETWNKDSVLKVIAEDELAARLKVCNIFGGSWSCSYPAEDFNMEYYPNGICDIVEV